jgi:hypothetical protein
MASWYYPSQLDRIEAKLDQALALLILVVKKESAMALDLTKLTADVQKQTDVVDSVETLLTGLSQAITDLKNQTSDPAVQQALDALATQIESNSQKLSDAVTANTPAA